MMNFVRAGFGLFIGAATFVGCWVVLLLMVGLLARIFSADDSDEE